MEQTKARKLEPRQITSLAEHGRSPRDHGGDLDTAIARFGGTPKDWIDLSTGINRRPFPFPPLTEMDWRSLPTRGDRDALCDAARRAYRTDAAIVPTAGAQAAIQLVPRLATAPGRAAVLSPTYNEHAAALRTNGWEVEEVGSLDELHGADAEIAVVVNPNNPDGRRHEPDALLQLLRNVGRLIVDESFVDCTPEWSLAPHAGRPGLIVLRSFGKFYGLAGLRLGFALGNETDIARLTEWAGPWAVSGPAIAIGRAALSDAAWAEATAARLLADAARLDALADAAGWTKIGGTALFGLYDVGDASSVREGLARHHIWSRIFPWSRRFLRLGLPGTETEWQRLTGAIEAARELPRSRE